ncbi:MAG: BON domain-containing protein [Pirellulaceae bacterium]|nr:BON domain-containing protein [Pirellulaceae bacterium]
MKRLHFALIAILMIAGCDNANRNVNAPPMKDGAGSSVDRDNSAINDRDRNTNAKTPLDQNENQADINITAGIRKNIVNTKMSVNAQNVKIITQDGTVTLRGPVKSSDEKKQVEDIARNFAGVKTVDSQLEIEKNL